ncbi:hypothetical protein CFOL_v3_05819 [Cephalotus follicularis]|uniref:Uncharacterized protein n=1 Tax=Cephalotus follicularis TaxID=3775 RepID=A0A1Q3B324_CEPFO|nr:hypothetical protein CFOL_v3_05819 [Cephalotus follicularis]
MYMIYTLSTITRLGSDSGFSIRVLKFMLRNMDLELTTSQLVEFLKWNQGSEIKKSSISSFCKKNHSISSISFSLSTSPLYEDLSFSSVSHTPQIISSCEQNPYSTS